jgi:hypothetical protein
MVDLCKSPEGQQKLIDWYDAAIGRIDADLPGEPGRRGLRS